MGGSYMGDVDSRRPVVELAHHPRLRPGSHAARSKGPVSSLRPHKKEDKYEIDTFAPERRAFRRYQTQEYPP